MIKDKLIHHKCYTGRVQETPQYYLMHSKDMEIGLVKHLKWDAEYNMLSVYNDAAHQDFVTKTFYARFTDIQPAEKPLHSVKFASQGTEYEQMTLF